MSEVRTSKTQPQGPAFQPKGEDLPIQPKSPAKGLSASKASKVAKVAKVVVPAHTTAKGQVSQCQVLTAKGQCSNPARHPYGKGWTCTTHGKRVAMGKVYKVVSKVQPYDPSLWGGKVPASK